MADGQSLTVQIDADADGATSGISRVADALDAIIAKIQATSDAGTEMGADVARAHGVAGAAAEAHAAKEEIAGASIGRVETAANSAARMFAALGLETGAATERVEAFAGALDGLQASAAPLLAVGAAALAVGEAFHFISDGIKDAASEAASLSQIRNALESQGASWDVDREAVESFTKALRENSTFSNGEILESLNQLIQRGLTLAQAEEASTAAAKLAAAEHLSLRDATDLLTSSEGARVKQLEKYDPALKSLIDRHASLHDIVLQVSQDFDGALAASLDNVDGRAKNLGNEWANLGADVGKLTNGPLSDLLDTLDSMVKGFDNALDAYERLQDALKLTQSETTTDLGRGYSRGYTEDTSKGGGFGGEAGDDMFERYARSAGKTAPYNAPTGMQHDGSAAEADEQIHRRIDMVNELFRTNRMSYAEALRQENELRDNYKLTTAQVDALQMATLRLQDERATKAKEAAEAAKRDSRAAGKATFEFEPGDEGDVKGPDKYEQSQKRLEQTLKGVEDADRSSKDAIAGSASLWSEYASKVASAQAETAEASKAIAAIGSVLNTQKTQQHELTTELHEQAAAADKAWQAYLEYGKTLGSDPSGKEREHLAELKKRHDELATAADATSKKLGELAGYMETNREAAARFNEQLHAMPDLMAEIGRQADGQRAHISDWVNSQVESAEKSNEPFINAQDEASTYGKSIQQQIDYYRSRIALLDQSDAVQREEAEKYQEQILGLELDGYKQRVEAQTKFVENAQSLESTFLDNILTKHQSLRVSLKEIFGDIEGDFVKMLEQMIVKSSILNGLNADLAKIFTVGGGGENGSLSLPGLGGVLGGAGGGTSGPSGAWTQDTPGSNLVFDMGSQSVLAMTGSPTGVIPGSVGPGGDFDPSKWDAYSTTFGDGTHTYGPSALQTTIGNAAIGGGYGEIVAGLDNGNATYAGIGGALGGILASGIPGIIAKANPLAGLGLEIGGSLLGSLLSGGQPTAAKNPDEFEGQTGYGQDVADLQFGQASASGVNYYPSAAIAKFVAAEGVGSGTITGGANQGTQIRNSNGTIASAGGVDAAEMWLNQNKGDTAAQLEAMGVSPAQFSQWVSLFGESATGSGAYTHYDKNVGDIEITGAQTGGNTKTTTAALSAALSSIITASGNSSSETSPVFSVSRAYPNMQIGKLNADGTYTETTSGVNIPTSQTTTPSTKPGTVTTSPVSSDGMTDDPIAHGISLTVNITGTQLLGTKGVQDFADQIVPEISKAMRRYSTGQIAGGTAARAGSRTGNY